MKRSYFFGAILAALALFAVWYSLEDSAGPTRVRSSTLLADVSPNSLRGITVRSGDKEVRLALTDSGWTLPAREGYPADANKVRSLLLKLFDLSSSQRLPSSEAMYDKLGVAATPGEKGQGEIELLNEQQDVVARLFLGKKRDESTGAGQYVRRDGQEEVLLVAQPLTPEAEVASWLETQVINVREANIYAIEQYRVDEDGRTLSFALQRSLAADGGWGPLVLTHPSTLDAPLEESVVSQIRGALENTRLRDVEAASAEESQTFDYETVFKLTTGIQYSVATRKEGDEFVAKITVASPEPLIEALKADSVESEALRQKEQQTSEAKKQAQATDEKASTAVETGAGAETGDGGTAEDAGTSGNETNGGESDEPTKPKKPKEEARKEPLINLASAADLKALQQRFEKWRYILPEFQAKRFRYPLEALYRKEVPGGAEQEP